MGKNSAFADSGFALRPVPSIQRNLRADGLRPAIPRPPAHRHPDAGIVTGGATHFDVPMAFRRVQYGRIGLKCVAPTLMSGSCDCAALWYNAPVDAGVA